jgi:site-specific DNA-cytosine methylase/SNF2 family DNA or RNA helicase
MTRLHTKKSDRKIKDFFTKSPIGAAASKRKRGDSEESEPADKTILRKRSRVSLGQTTIRHVPIAWVDLPSYDEAFLATYRTHQPTDGVETDSITVKAETDRQLQGGHDDKDHDIPAKDQPTSPPKDGQRRNRRASRPRVRYTEQPFEDDEMEDEEKDRRRVSKGAPKRHDESDFEGQSSESEDEVQSSDNVSEAESTPPTSDTYSEDELTPKAKSKSKVKQESRANKESMPTASRSQGDTSASRMKKLCGSGGGLDLTLPPLHKVEDIFSDITDRAVGFGMQSAVDDLKARKRPFRVATMCSGTESPLLALRMIQNCLAASGRSMDDTTIEHVFSAEIVPYKQAYIERNFAPSIIFRDITELTTAVEDENPVATTVYGAKVPVPRDIDLVIAGTSCVDFSRLNKKQKDMDSGGESGDTWSAVLAFCRVFKPAIVLLENVYTAHWNKMLGHYEDIGYESAGVRLDSKDYYLPQTRQRGYMACFNQEKMGSTKASPGERWTSLMERFRRPASAPASSFLQQSNEAKLMLDEPVTREVDWEKCAVRQMVYRQTMKLGNARPITHWQESNTMLPPEHSSRAWFKRQVQRVLDTIDCAHIRNALTQNGAYDSHFKTRIWDLSQNVDRERDARKFGIVGCITPSGIFFVSDAGRALTPEELLSLQGIPLDEISFTTESPSEIQDLAGNAMSAPVVGCAIAAALIAASPARLLDCHEGTDEATASAKQETKKAEIVTGHPEALSFKSSVAGFDLDRILHGAEQSSRMCYCEGAKGSATASIQKCADCYHTICTACGGNPVHNYQPASLAQVRKSAREFEDELRAALPLRLKFATETVVDTLRSHHQQDFLDIIALALADDFCLSNVRRSYCWTATYSNAHAHLDFVISDGRAEWQLHVDAPVTLSGKSILRRFLDLPIAKSRVLHAPLGDDWQWRLPSRISTEATIQAEGKQISSWWNRLGMPEYQTHYLPEQLEVVCQAGPLAEALNGTYQYLPNCGKASNSLYKRVGGDHDNDQRPLYLFLDPTRVGDPQDDVFVFSRNNAKLDYGEVREVIAQVEAAWKPWPYNKTSKSVEVSVAHTWTSFDGCGPVAREYELEMKLHGIDGLRGLAQHTDCTSAVMAASCTLPNALSSQTIPPTDDKFFASQSGVFEALRRNLPGSSWMPFALSGKSCQHGCAPSIPETRWCLNTEEKLTPYDDPASAGIYERAIKARVHPIFVEIQDSTLQLCVNVATLAHRAAARLPASVEKIRFQWRLVVDAQDIGSHASRKPFHIQATTNIAPFAGSIGSLNLFPKQRMALAWMKAQELGTGFMLEEVADAEISALGWRSEVRAECLTNVRGGICADHPGFGKTITSLALIESHYSDAGRAAIEADIATRQHGIATGLIPTAATLIVCPPHLLQQWVIEIDEKLGSSKNVLAIRIAKDLSKYTVEDFKQAKIIVANRKLFANDAYLERLAALAAVPAPFTISGRSFQKWMQFASKQIPKHLSVFKTHGATGLTKEVKKRFRENIDSEVFQAAIPSRRLRGAAYLARDKATKSISSNTATIDTSSVGKPLFEMFYFNRLIVDEFHESDPKEMAHIVHLQADKRWGLSGTPAMDDPYDVAQIARLLGVALRTGSVARGIMKKRNRDELRKDMTQFQLFDVMRETPSDVQQSRVHAHAQKFLDTFVRQNVMDFDIPFEEHLVPAVLDSTHRALYMELSQHLNSHDMQIKKVKMGKSGTQLERQKALGEDLSLAPTAEGVLSCKAAYSDGTDLAEVVRRRKAEVKKILGDLPALMRLAYAKEKVYFVKFLADVRGGSFGDAETTAQILELAPAQAKADSNVVDGKGRKKGGDDSDDVGDSNSKRDHTAKLNTMCKQLLISKRSERYVSNLSSINESLLGKQTQSDCDSTECDHQLDGDKRAVSAFCGHVICRSCFQRSQQSLSVMCPAEGCSSELYNYHLLWRQKMGDPTTKMHGAKLASAMSLLKTIQHNIEQAIVFVQFSSQLAEVKAALKANGLPAIIVHSENESEKIEDFKTSSSDTAVAIVLNTADRTASGANLQNANHVIFLSPLLKNSQYEYSATMAQAIGRVRRHGQKRDVHVHRLVALDTIDVDILEHRERRTTALSERDQLPDQNSRPQSSQPERTQLIRDSEGHFSLQPRSWLINGSCNGQGTTASNSKGRVPGYEDFSSLVKFSGAYAEGDD